MHALTVQQPFATLILLGLKTAETRRWPTDYRGPLLIHASASSTLPKSMVDYAWAVLAKVGVVAPLPVRAIIGGVQLTDCDVAKTDRFTDMHLGYYGPGWFAFQMRDPVLFNHAIPCGGDIGLWQLPRRLIAKVPLSFSGRHTSLRSHRPFD